MPSPDHTILSRMAAASESIPPNHEGIGAMRCETFCHSSKSQAGKVFELVSRPMDVVQLPWKQWKNILFSRFRDRPSYGKKE